MARNPGTAPRVTVVVTQEMIDKAIMRDSGHCMISDAVCAAYPAARGPSTDLATIRFSDPTTGKRYIYLTPRVAQLALLDFDQGKPMHPFTFRIRAAQVVNMRGPRGRTTLKRDGTNDGSESVPVRHGGKAPPTGALSDGLSARRTGRIRRYGLRMLKE